MTTTQYLDQLTDRERSVLAEALQTRALLTLPMQDHRTLADKADAIATLTSIARKVGVDVHPAPDSILGIAFKAPGQTISTVSHDDCERCQEALSAAETYARVTGSVGASYTYDDSACGGEVHEARWQR